MKQIVRLCLSASLAIAAWAQTKPAEFDVASIRPAPPGQEQRKNGPRLHPVRTTPGTVFMINVDLGLAIAWAWDVAPFQLVGQSLPDSTFDIVAKAAGPATDEEIISSSLEAATGPSVNPQVVVTPISNMSTPYSRENLLWPSFTLIRDRCPVRRLNRMTKADDASMDSVLNCAKRTVDTGLALAN
jgi:hypothetical protein